MKEKQSPTRNNLNTAAKVAVGVALIFSGSMAFRQDQAEGKASYKSTSYEGPLTLIVPAETARPIRISDRINAGRKTDLAGENKDNSPGGINAVDVFSSQSVIPSPEPRLSPQEQKIQDLQNEAAQYVQIAQESGKFSDKEIEDIKMYYPIYKAVADQFHIDWYLIWINHEAETGASRSTIAFNGKTYPYFGGWQRNVITWPKEYVDAAFKGFEYLQSIKTRNKTDASEAAAMAAQVAPNIKERANLDPYQAVLEAEMIFTGDKAGTGIALTRADLWREDSKIFGSVLIPHS